MASDERSHTHLARRYYDTALDIAHTVVSLNAVPTRAGLEAIATFRARMLATIGPFEREPAPPERVPAAPSPVEPADTADTVTGQDIAARPETPGDLGPEPLEDLLAELDALVGLDAVKHRVRLVADLLRVRQLRAERGLPTASASHHLVFTGNPGTCKTTVARLLARIYRSLGLLASGHLVEVDRSGLVAGFVGQTAPQVTARFDEADQGMLFVDEAYALARGNEGDFGREAIDQIVKLMEDRRDRVVLVVAGYADEMAAFPGTNPGLRSRFPTVIDFPDYSTDELVEIVTRLGRRQRYELDDGATRRLRELLDAAERTQGFGNARLGRNLFEAAVANHASRVVRTGAEPTTAQLTTLTAEDLPGGLGQLP